MCMYARGCSQLWLPGDPIPGDLVDEVISGRIHAGIMAN